MEIHKIIEEHWHKPDKIVERITAENAKEHNHNGNLPLHRVLSIPRRSSEFENGHLRVVEKLLKLYPKGAKCKNFYSRLPIHCANKYSSSESMIEAVKLTLKAYPKALSVEDKDGLLPLRSEFAFRHLTKYLIKNFPRWIAIEDGFRYLPIHYAVKFDNVEAYKLCYNAFPEGVKAKTILGDLPIHFASSQEVVQQLMSDDPDSVKVQNNNGELPLHMAAISYKHVVESILDAYPEGAKRADGNGNLPIHFAVRCDVTSVQKLLDSYPESAKAQNNDGDLPLHMSVMADSSGNRRKVMKTIFDAYPDGSKISNKTGNLPIHIAAQYCRAQETFQLLLDEYPEGIKSTNEEGCTPMSLASEESIMPIVLANKSVFSMDGDSFNEHPIWRYIHDHCPNIAKFRLANITTLFQLAHSAGKDEAERTKALENDLKAARIKIDELKAQCTITNAHAQVPVQIQPTNSAQSSSSQSQEDDAEDRIQLLETQLQAKQTQLDEMKKHEVELRELLMRKVTEDNADAWSLDQLQEMMTSLDARVTQLRHVLRPQEKPSKTQKVVELLSKLCEEGIEANRDDVVESISDLNQELLELEGHNENRVDNGPARKRARVSVSP